MALTGQRRFDERRLKRVRWLRGACGLGVVCGVLLIAGCSTTPDAVNGPAGNATPATAPQRVSTSNSSTSRPSTPRSSSSAAIASPAAVGRPCRSSQLTVTHADGTGGLGHHSVVVVFRNRSTSNCLLGGYPTATVVDGTGRQIAKAKPIEQGYLGGCRCAGVSVVVKPAAAASALVEGDVQGGKECLAGKALLVTAPTTKTVTRVPFDAYSCRVQVHPIVAGTGGGAAS